MTTWLGETAAHYWNEYLGKIAAALEPLGEEQVWWRPDEGSNSVGNLLAHLDGNLSQWVLAGLGGEPYERHRDAEFAARGGASKAELLAHLRATVERCCAVAARLTDDDLARPHRIQKYELDGARALFHTVEHMSYHTGQIVLLAKLHGARLDFYPQHRGE
jgi:uncharacterized damage-inducible protein DinB